MITISAQYGDPQSFEVLRPLHKKLNLNFDKYLINTYFKSIKKLSIVWRVCGKVGSFGANDGPERLRYYKQDQCVTIDFVIQEYQWIDKTIEEIKEFIATGMESCFQLLLKRAEKASELLDKELLQDDFNKAMKEFRQAEEF